MLPQKTNGKSRNASRCNTRQSPKAILYNFPPPQAKQFFSGMEKEPKKQHTRPANASGCEALFLFTKRISRYRQSQKSIGLRKPETYSASFIVWRKLLSISLSLSRSTLSSALALGRILLGSSSITYGVMNTSISVLPRLFS